MDKKQKNIIIFTLAAILLCELLVAVIYTTNKETFIAYKGFKESRDILYEDGVQALRNYIITNHSHPQSLLNKIESLTNHSVEYLKSYWDQGYYDALNKKNRVANTFTVMHILALFSFIIGTVCFVNARKKD